MVTLGSDSASLRAKAKEPSVEQSSTMIHSKSQNDWQMTDSKVSEKTHSALYRGVMIEHVGIISFVMFKFRIYFCNSKRRD